MKIYGGNKKYIPSFSMKARQEETWMDNTKRKP